jgi:hypothetical protein
MAAAAVIVTGGDSGADIERLAGAVRVRRLAVEGETGGSECR